MKVKTMIIHRLTVTVTLIETTTISITQSGERTNEAAPDPDDRPVARPAHRRGLRRRADPHPRASPPDSGANEVSHSGD
jgi:hypothetical protein